MAHEKSLPVEIIIRAVVTGDGRSVYTIGGTPVEGPETEIEIVSMRGEVLKRIPVSEIADWVSRNHYRYVPRTRGNYHRESVSA